ncbi:MAG: hypothetical protein WCP45_06885 [Verrucomicrobiota bacterium]
MRSNIQLTLLPALACLWCAVPAAAQKATMQVSMKIDVVAWGETIPGLTLKPGKNGEPVTALAFRYSKPVSYAGSNILEISQNPGSTTAAPPPTPSPAAAPPVDPAAAPAVDTAAQLAAALAAKRKDNPNLVALAILPGDSKHVTVLLAPAAGGTFTAHVIDDDPSKLPMGRLRIHNLSPHYIAMRCNNAAVSKLRPKEAIMVEPKNQEVIYELAYQKDGEWVDQENNIATVRDDEQAQLIVLQSDATFFTSTDGSRGGFLQTVVLRRSKHDFGPLAELDPAAKSAIVARNLAQEQAAERKANKKPAPKKP